MKKFNLYQYLYDNGMQNLKHTGDSIMGSCPYFDHQDNNPSWSIYDKYPYFFKCFGCGRSGTLITLKRDLGFEGVIPGMSLPTDEEDIELQECIELIQSVDEVTVDEGLKPVGFPAGFHSIYEAEKLPDIRAYLDSRGVWDEVNSYKEHYCLGVAEGYEKYVVLPILQGGNCIYWTSRAYSNDIPKNKRFLNPKSEKGMYSKSTVVYSPRRPRSDVYECVVVEGQFDVIKLLSLGVNAVGTFNASPSQMQIRGIAREFKSVVIAYDNDMAGRLGADKMSRALLQLGCEVSIMTVEQAEDAGDYNTITEFKKDYLNRKKLLDFCL